MTDDKRCPLCGSKPTKREEFCARLACYLPCALWPAVQALKDRIAILNQQLAEPHPDRDLVAEFNALLAAKNARIAELEAFIGTSHNASRPRTETERDNTRLALENVRLKQRIAEERESVRRLILKDKTE